MDMQLNKEKDWEAYYDAKTLISAERIKADVTKLAKAQAAAEDMIKEQENEKNILKRISKLKSK